MFNLFKFKKKYFWDEFVTDEYIIDNKTGKKVKKENYYESKLLRYKEDISLALLYGAYFDKYIMSEYSEEYILAYSSDASHDKFLEYLRPLLEEGKLKIMVCDLELTTATEEFIQTHKNTFRSENN